MARSFCDATLLAYPVLPLQTDLMTVIYSGSPALRTSGFSSLKLKKKNLEVIFSRVEDRVPPVSLDDGRSLLTSGLQDFDKSTLLCSSKGLTFVHLFLDPTNVDPRCSDPTDQICTSPLCFLWSLGIDLTVIGYSGLVIQ
jgi:hypothetical protein